MSSFSGRALRLGFVVGALLSMPLAVRAQFVTDINGLFDNGSYTLFCCPSNLSVTNNYPTSAVIDDDYTATSGGAGHANRYDLRFSSDSGSTARLFDGTDSFDVSFDVKLEAGANTPRKEAGLIIDQSIGGSQFIVNTDGTPTSGGGEIVVFGGFQPFYSFNMQHGISYTAGETINMRMIYKGKTVTTPGNFQYIVKKNNITYSSPVIDSGAGEMGIADNSSLLLYLQGNPATAADFARATFSNIVFGTGLSVPGDYSGNGLVDAADYVMWRQDVTPLPNEVSGITTGDTTPEDYTAWRERFGNPNGGSGGSGLGAIPEPSGIAFLAGAAFAAIGALRRR